MQISDLADWVRDLDEPSVAPLLEALLSTRDSFGEIGLGYLSLDRATGLAGRRAGERLERRRGREGRPEPGTASGRGRS
jgi:hypothetical protein